jgi:hypothetical protein
MNNRVKWSETVDDSEWDRFVTQNGGSIFHLWSWRKVLEDSGSKPLYLACRDSKGELLAVCPFVYRAGRRLRYLDSLPDSSVAGPLLGPLESNTRKILSSLRKAVKFTPFNPVVAMRIRAHQAQIIQPLLELGFLHSVDRGLFILDLAEGTPERIWNDGFQKHDRQAVKYYEQKGPGFEVVERDRDYTSFLALERGSSVHKTDREAFLDRMRSNLGDKLKLGLVTVGVDVVAGVLMLCDTTSSTLRLSMMRFSPTRNIHSPVTYANWEAINWAKGHGFRFVDFGSYPVASSSNPEHPYHRLRTRFEVDFVPRYQFTLPTSSISFAIARRITRLM